MTLATSVSNVNVERVSAWLDASLGLRTQVVSMTRPGHGGMSGDTCVVELTGDEWLRDGVVIKLEASASTYPEPRLRREFDVLSLLNLRWGLPVPTTLAYERDSAWLGRPFMVTKRVLGRSPPDRPIYHRRGWLAEARPQEQRALWWSGLEAMAQIHQLGIQDDLAGVLQGGVDRDAHVAQLDEWERYLEWVQRDEDLSIATAALAWLRDRIPASGGRPAVCWGDARLGNMIFTDFECRAMVDWEMARFGRPEEDLAWWLFHDHHHSEGLRLPRLRGLPSPDETIERYGEVLGRPMEDMDYYEVLAALRLGLITVRVVQLRRQIEPSVASFLAEIPSFALLKKMIG
jgi:aminoglycoside phosphotransferase (APT) family kinase protein